MIPTLGTRTGVSFERIPICLLYNALNIVTPIQEITPICEQNGYMKDKIPSQNLSWLWPMNPC